MVAPWRRSAVLVGTLSLSTILFAGLWLSSVGAASFSGVKHGRFDAVDGGGSGCAPSSFKDLPGAKKTFTLGGTVNRPVLVQVSLQVKNPDQDDVFGVVRMLVDGGQQGVGPLNWDLQSNAVSDTGMPSSYTFLTLALTPGSHTVKLQWLAVGGGSNFCIDHWTLAIIHF